MQVWKEEYVLLNPKNGWGNYDSALDNLIEMRDAFPSGTFKVFPSRVCSRIMLLETRRASHLK